MIWILESSIRLFKKNASAKIIADILDSPSDKAAVQPPFISVKEITGKTALAFIKK